MITTAAQIVIMNVIITRDQNRLRDHAIEQRIAFVIITNHASMITTIAQSELAICALSPKSIDLHSESG